MPLDAKNSQQRTIWSPGPDRIFLAGVPADALTRSELFDVLDREVILHPEVPLLVGSFNLTYIGWYGVDADYEAFFTDSEARGRRWLVTLDGTPVVKAARRLSTAPWEKLSGSDLLTDVLQHAFEQGWSVGNLGATSEANEKFVAHAAQRWPGLSVVTWAPSRTELTDESDRIATEIKNAGVDVLIVSLPKPIAELWMDQHAQECGAAVSLAFGASIDFLIGAQHRAPLVFQRAGLEWLWRLVHSPKRLFRRYVIEGPGEWWRLRRFSGTTPQTTSPQQWRSRISQLLLAADIVVALVASLLAALLRQALSDAGFVGYSPSVGTVLMAVPLLVAAIGVSGGRRATGVRIDARLYGRFLRGVLIGASLVGLTSFLFKLNTARGYVALLTGLSVLGGLTLRWVYSRYLERSRRRGRNMVRLLGVGQGQALADALKWFSTHPGLGYRVVGNASSLPSPTGLHAGVLAVDGSDPTMIRDADDLMRARGEVMVVPDLVSVDASRLHPDTFADLSVLHVAPVELGGYRAAAKRGLDVAVSLIMLTLAALPLAIVALAIKREDGGPVIFRQTRVGLDGRPFAVLKLRTMAIDAEARLAELQKSNEAGPFLFKMADDPRITRVGRRLRSWSIDELPQLWNVLRGDMSLVGPRPALPSEVALFPPEAHRRHRVRPGLTGLWQVSGRSDLDSAQALALDIHYVANWSLSSDLSILLRTVRAVLGRHGAH